MVQNLSALATFITVAKHQSFTKASKKLHLTQGAVSIQIKQLEEELGFKLFKRETRQIFLTQEGQDLLSVVEPAIKQIQTKVESIRSKGLDGTLTVTTLPSFASKWLIPRLMQFQRLYPEIDLRIHTSDHLVDFVSDKVDCAIRYGSGNYSDLFVDHIIDEIYCPVYSPDLVADGKPLEKPEDIQYFPILHDDYATEDYNIAWKKWAERMKVQELDVDRGLQYGQSDFVIQAAIAGQGIALARISLVGDDLKTGLLIPLYNSSLISEFSYFFVCPHEYKALPKVLAFKDWIIEKMREETIASSALLQIAT